MSTRRLLVTFAFIAAAAILIALPAPAEAQHHPGPPHGGSRVVVSVGVGFGWGYPAWGYPGWGYPGWGYPGWGYPYGAHGPWTPWGPYGPHGPYGPWGYPAYAPYYAYDEFLSSIKFEVKQKDAEVYVDGSFAGEIDNFDGLFQSLRVRPGNHEIVVYREGFRSVSEHLYLDPYADRKLRFTLSPLLPGEPQDPRPTPAPRRAEPEERTPPPQSTSRYYAQRLPEPEPPPQTDERARVGTLSIRIRPLDADIIVDGHNWKGLGETERLYLELTIGRHTVEVRKEGYTTYTEDVLIRERATLTLNVSLTKK